MALDYRWLEFRTGVRQALDPTGVVATAASAIVFDYEALLQEKVDSKPVAEPQQHIRPTLSAAEMAEAAQPPALGPRHL